MPEPNATESYGATAAVDIPAETDATGNDERKPLIPASDDRSHATNVVLLIVIIGFGMLEGAAFQRSGIVVPSAIAGQMVFKVWVVLKMFLAAVGSSMITQGIMNAALSSDFDRSRMFRKKKAGFIRAILGAAVLGIGMALSGSGPTMLPAQIGAGVEKSWCTFLGLMLGAVTFSIIDKVAPTVFSPPPEDDNQAITVDKKLNNFRYEFLSIPIGFVLVGAAVGLEFVVTQSDDEDRFKQGSFPWAPTIAGAVVGLNQIPIRLIAGHGQGGSMSVMNIVGTLSCGLLAPNYRVTSFAKVWQFAVVWIGTSMGSLASSQINDAPHPPGFTYWRGLVGGFFMIFGARVAGGCTCGHGVSGFAELSLESVCATVAIFGAGIATGFIVEAAGGSMCCQF